MKDLSQKRVTNLAFATVIVCFLISTVISLWSLHIMSQHNQREFSKVLAAQIYDDISYELSQPVMVSRTMAHDSFLIETLEKENQGNRNATILISNYLRGIHTGLNYESVFVVSQSTGRYYTMEGLNKEIDPENNPYDRWYTTFVESGDEYGLDVDSDEFGQDAWTVFVNCRIEDEDKTLLGVCGVGVRMNRSIELFDTLQKDYNVRIFLIDKNHLIQVNTDESRIETAYLDEIDLKSVTPNQYFYQKLDSDRIAVIRYVDPLDWYLVVESDGSNERGQFVSVILLNIAAFLLILIIMALAIRAIAHRTMVLSDASLKDHSTGLYNRRAFEEEKARLANTALDANFVYMIADLNGLKAANDTLGHEAGDELIKGASDTLKSCFGKHGTLYRIGGDEFAALLVADPETLEQRKKQFDRETASWSGTMVKDLSVSTGFASSREFPSENITELSRIADERMYAAKDMYYTSTGKARRTI